MIEGKLQVNDPQQHNRSYTEVVLHYECNECHIGLDSLRCIQVVSYNATLWQQSEGSRNSILITKMQKSLGMSPVEHSVRTSKPMRDRPNACCSALAVACIAFIGSTSPAMHASTWNIYYYEPLAAIA